VGERERQRRPVAFLSLGTRAILCRESRQLLDL
jgi:hypothetical protein